MHERVRHHRATSPCSFDEYVAQQRREIARGLAAKHVVYFDTNVWKCLSDFLRGKGNLTPAMKAFCELASSEHVLSACAFPIGLSTLFELQSMSDPLTRSTLVELVDRYSRNVCLLSHIDIVRDELAIFMRTPSLPAQEPPSRFCRAGELLITPRATFPPGILPSEEERVWRKAIYDLIAALPVSSQLEMAQGSGIKPWDNMAGIAAMNDGKRAHQQRIKTYPDAVYVELAGSLSLYLPERPLIGGFTQPNHWAIQAMLHWHEHPDSKHLVTARVIAHLHAVMRFHGMRVFKRGDVADFATAASAVPVCHALFTDERLVRIAYDHHSDIPKFAACELVHGFDQFTAHLQAHT
ncbi:hypothetical protein [Variovorax sp. 22077]|uniref:hypothetical protein n=1 Tax=Variovorax sp. 22077 TaxID=3453867 RepID=UPI003F8478C8